MKVKVLQRRRQTAENVDKAITLAFILASAAVIAHAWRKTKKAKTERDS